MLLFLFLIGCMIYIRVNWWLYFLFHKVMPLYFFSFPRRSRVNSKEIKSKVTFNLRLPSLKKKYITSILTFNYPIKPSNKKKCLTGRPSPACAPFASAPASRGNNIEARIRRVFLGLTVYLILGERTKMIFEILLHLHGISLPEILSDVLQSFSLSWEGSQLP